MTNDVEMSYLRRRSWSADFENMEDTEHLLDEEDDTNGVSRSEPAGPSDDWDIEADKQPLTDRQHETPVPQNDRKVLSYIMGLGVAFMFVFSAFNTNGIMTVSVDWYV